MLNVYAIKATGNFGGGLAVVAASSKAEAIALASHIEDQIWRVRYCTPDHVETLLGAWSAGPPRVLTHYETGE